VNKEIERYEGELRELRNLVKKLTMENYILRGKINHIARNDSIENFIHEEY